MYPNVQVRACFPGPQPPPPPASPSPLKEGCCDTHSTLGSGVFKHLCCRPRRQRLPNSEVLRTVTHLQRLKLYKHDMQVDDFFTVTLCLDVRQMSVVDRRSDLRRLEVPSPDTKSTRRVPRTVVVPCTRTFILPRRFRSSESSSF